MTVYWTTASKKHDLHVFDVAKQFHLSRYSMWVEIQSYLSLLISWVIFRLNGVLFYFVLN